MILSFEKISKKDVEFAGGKGVAIGELFRAGFLVPPGFVITTEVFERFLKEAGLPEKIDQILEMISAEKFKIIEKVSEEIQKLIKNAEISEKIKADLKKAFKELGVESVAVRSSATAEDGKNDAWAGQLESYLNISENNFLEAVKSCWASLFSPRAIFYRLEKRNRKEKISVAVVVQKMIESEVSGVGFSVHPVTSEENQIFIEAGSGLGEAVVSGSIIPDSYIFDKENKIILDKAVQKEGGILPDGEVVKLAELIEKIEKQFGFPVDVEWAKENGVFYVIQSRPITALRKYDNFIDYIKAQSWFFGIRADESLLFYSVKRNGYSKYLKSEHGISFAETLLIPIKKNYPIRVFNLEQSKFFHNISKRKVLRNPQILVSYLKKNNSVWQSIVEEGRKLAQAIENGDCRNSIAIFEKVMDLYEIASAQFIIIFSLGLKLTESKNNFSGKKEILEMHNKWRNSVVFGEEKMGDGLFYFLKFFTICRKLKIDSLELMKRLTLNELLDWMKEKSSNKDVLKKIKLRQRQGFIYLNLKKEKREISDDIEEIKKLRSYFSKLEKSELKQTGGEIIGESVLRTDKKIKGKVLVIKDKSTLKRKSHLLKNRILVAIQTTPHYIPFLKGAKAMITDEGGLTCHAAILARELNKPCIVGTKIATQVLKDGDLVEMDTIKGIIKK